LKHFEVTSGKNVRQVLEFQPKANIGLITPKTSHRLMKTHSRERRLDGLSHEVFPDDRHHFFHQRKKCFLIQKRNLNINLRKLWLAIGPKVFISKTASHLKIAIHPTDHQEL